jgi:hypothetical protein
MFTKIIPKIKKNMKEIIRALKISPRELKRLERAILSL